METEPVIFRRAKNPYTKATDYYAIFPEDPTRPGMLEFVCWHYLENGDAIFEPFGEMSHGFYYDSTRLVHKDDLIIPTLVQTLERYCSHPQIKVRVMERMNRR